jgi:hypothetical protein
MHESFRVDVEAKRLNGEPAGVIGESFCLIDDMERLKWREWGVGRCARSKGMPTAALLVTPADAVAQGRWPSRGRRQP